MPQYTPEDLLRASENIRSLNLMQIVGKFEGIDDAFYDLCTELEKDEDVILRKASRYLNLAPSRAVFIKDCVSLRNIAAGLGSRQDRATNRQLFALLLDIFEKMAGLTPKDLEEKLEVQS